MGDLLVNKRDNLHLGYRSLFTIEGIDPDQDLGQVVEVEFRNWVRPRQPGEDLLPTWPGTGYLDLGAHLSVNGTNLDDARSGRIRRLYQFDNHQKGRHFLINVYAIGMANPKGKQQVLVEGYSDAPDRDSAMEEFSTPLFVRNLIGGRRAFAGDTRLTERPRPVHPHDVREAVEQVLDPGRTVPVTLAASPATENNAAWAKVVEALVRDSIGMSLTYTIPFEVVDEVNESLPASLTVKPGTARTYLPGVDGDDPAEPFRHRVIGAEALSGAIFSTEKGLGVRNFLKRAHARGVRRHALAHPLPKEARRVVALAEKTLLKQQREQQVQERVKDTRPERTLAVPAAGTLSEALVSRAQTVGERVLAFFSGIFGTDLESVDPVAEIEGTYRTLQEKDAEVHALWEAFGAENEQLGARVEELEEQGNQHLLEVEELQIDIALAQSEADKLQRKADYYRDQLIELRRADLLAVPFEDLWDPPQDIDELVDRIGPGSGAVHPAQEYVWFTGNRQLLEELTKRDPAGAWTGRIWSYVHALHDYARAKKEQNFRGDFYAYLHSEDVPGAKTSTGNFAPKESESVNNRREWRNARIFPVPTAADRSGTAYMEAHFRIATTDSFAPRMHFFDDTATTGKIYVGYIGRHLPNTKGA